jgi:endoglucanase
MRCVSLIIMMGGLDVARAVVLGVGTNLGDTLEAPFEGAWHRPAQEYYFSDFKAAGFSTVRIPVRWDNHTGLTPPYTINATWLERVKTVVGWCLAQDLQCIINSHWDTWLDQANSSLFEAALPRYRAIWEQVSAAFAGAPPALFFESYNEPHLMSTDSLNSMLATFYAAVRPLHPTRLLILGWLNYMGPSWIQQDGAQNWNAMVLPGGGSDPNLAVETHSYDPYEVCGKGSEPWGKPSDLAAMAFMFGNTSLWSSQHGGVPVFMGECGCTKLQNRTGRLAWYSAFFGYVRSLPGQGGGGLVWDDEENYEVYNRTARTFDEGILAAIGL